MKEFVDYLNTLHKMGGSNGNATAEANYNTRYAKDILFKDLEFVEKIINALNKYHKVLLTGFAGDGKTTIARIIAEQELIDPWQLVKIDALDKPLVIIKDLSEIPDDDGENNRLYEHLTDKDINLLIVSNTGTIRRRLNSLSDKFSSDGFNIDIVKYQTEILKGIECGEGSDEGEIRLTDNLHIKSFNLVKRDNLKIAEQIFKNILNYKAWDSATEQERESVPYINRYFLVQNDYLALTRILCIYRRIYEYGDRLTIRNLIEHFAYTITGNCSSDIKFSKTEFNSIFYDNFFSHAAINVMMPGAVLVDNPHFGYNIDSSWKRSIWIGSNSEMYPVIFNDGWVMEYYKNSIRESNKVVCAYEQRLNIIRLIYFMNVAVSEKTWSDFKCSFLNSPGFRFFESIQESARIRKQDANLITTKIRHVVKEYYLGMKLPEASDSSNSKEVYIAVSRNNSNVKQTAQIILDIFKWDDTCIHVKPDSRGINQLVFIFDNDIELIVPLPFLDYLLNCHMGVMDDPRFSSFRKRLDNLKDQILCQRKSDSTAKMKIAFLDLKHDLSIVDYEMEDDMIVVTEA